MVGIVSAVAHGDFGKIARADHDPVPLVGHIHQDLCAFPGLRVLVHDIALFRIVAYGAEMLHACFSYVDFEQRDTKFMAEPAGISQRSMRRAETGHGDGDHISGAFPCQRHGFDGDQQGQGGIQSARDADDGSATTDMTQTLGQTASLNGDDLVAVVVLFRFPVGDKRIPRIDAGKFVRPRDRLELDRSTERVQLFRIVSERRFCIARPHDSGKVDIGVIQTALLAETRRIKQDRPVLCDQAVAAVHRVGRRFPAPR